MTASMLNHTLPLAVPTNIPSASNGLPILTTQPFKWSPVGVYRIVFGILAVLLAVPGAYLALLGLRRRRGPEARQSVLKVNLVNKEYMPTIYRCDE
jgi:hypothetical protein